MKKKFVFTIGVMSAFIASAVALNINNKAYAASGCLSGPDRPSGPGTHWHYRIDRVTKERCWYLKKIGGPSRARPSGEARSRPSNEERAGAAQTRSRRSSETPAKSETRTRPTSEARVNPPEPSTENESSLKAWFAATFAALSGPATSDTKMVAPELITREPAARKRRSNEAESERSEKSRSEREPTKTARAQQRPSAAEAAGDKDVTPPPSAQPEWEKALYEEFLQWRVKQLLFE